ncbi:MAG: phospho-sugar mutase, partial [Bacteroidia bacterium]|nr:phospho-sugar mutase [Bacteroidia bacterium]
PQDEEIIAEINALKFEDVKFSTRPELIQKIDAEVDEAFISACVANGDFNAPGKDDLHIVFTSLHGTSITAIPEVLKRAGYPKVTVIAEQAEPDGNFPTVESPNPEEPEALAMAIKKAEDLGADMVIGTDPDSDRLGIAVRNTEGEMQLLNGNHTMILMTEYLLEKRKERGFTGNEFIASTIVSTPMMRQMAAYFGVEYKEALTGFKWIAKMIKDFPDSYFVGGGEESFGFMVGDFVRDKDAVTSTLLACEIAAEKKAAGSSFYQALLDAFVKYGCYQEKLVSLTKKGIQGAEEIRQMMIDFKENPLKSIDGSPVILIDDYNTSTSTDPRTGASEQIDIPKSNVLIYTTEDGTRIAARPSGTEPKIKFYMSVNSSLPATSDYKTVHAALEKKLGRITEELKLG